MRRNLAVPLRRAARDLATAEGQELLLAKAAQILATEADSPSGSGELPWRTAFGSTIHLLRHRPNDGVLAELARVRARDALRVWLPTVRVTDCAVVRDGAVVTLVVSLLEGAAGGARDVRIPLGPAGAP